MAVNKTTFLYCYASGVARFGRSVPAGAMVIDSQTDEERDAEKMLLKAQAKLHKINHRKYEFPGTPWKRRMAVKMRLAYDGKTLLVPGVPEAETQAEKYKALQKFRRWAIK